MWVSLLPSSHIGCNRVPGQVLCDIWQFMRNLHGRLCVNAIFSICPTISFPQSRCAEYDGGDGRKQTGIKSLLVKVKEGEWRSWLKTQHFKKWPSWHQCHHFVANRCGKVETVTGFYFLELQSLWIVTAATKLKKMLALWKENHDKPR